MRMRPLSTFGSREAKGRWHPLPQMPPGPHHPAITGQDLMAQLHSVLETTQAPTRSSCHRCGGLSPSDGLNCSRSQQSGQEGSEPNVLAVHLVSSAILCCVLLRAKRKGKRCFQPLPLPSCCPNPGPLLGQGCRSLGTQNPRSCRPGPGFLSLLGEGGAFSPLNVEACIEGVWVP